MKYYVQVTARLGSLLWLAVLWICLCPEAASGLGVPKANGRAPELSPSAGSASWLGSNWQQLQQPPAAMAVLGQLRDHAYSPALSRQHGPLSAEDGERCPADCSGHGYCLQGSCECHVGFRGQACEDGRCRVEDKEACGEQVGRGTCDAATGECRCNPGWVGRFCEQRGCAHNCHGHGVCHLGLPDSLLHLPASARPAPAFCICFPGYFGEDCQLAEEAGAADDEQPATGQQGDEQQCPQDCSGHGICRAGRCLCHAGHWTGLDCSQPVCPRQCSGHGLCDQQTGKCKCASDNFGDGCELHTCMPPDCNGRGECDVRTSVCRCYEGAFGPNCAWDCPEQCNTPKGKCVSRLTGEEASAQNYSSMADETPLFQDELPAAGQDGQLHSSDFFCVCEEGWTGPTCAERDCGPFWTGPDCQQRRCPWGCSVPHGVCDPKTLQCQCFHPWQGMGCELEPCPDNCHYRGECRPGGVCVCKGGFSGARCEKTCDGMCLHGMCVHGSCYCEAGWKGKYCDQEHASTSPSSQAGSAPPPHQQDQNQQQRRGCFPPCKDGHGFCHQWWDQDQEQYAYSCLCADGYTGPDCSSRTGSG